VVQKSEGIRTAPYGLRSIGRNRAILGKGGGATAEKRYNLVKGGLRSQGPKKTIKVGRATSRKGKVKIKTKTWKDEKKKKKKAGRRSKTNGRGAAYGGRWKEGGGQAEQTA